MLADLYAWLWQPRGIKVADINARQAGLCCEGMRLEVFRREGCGRAVVVEGYDCFMYALYDTPSLYTR
jgi:hypothetical protein